MDDGRFLGRDKLFSWAVTKYIRDLSCHFSLGQHQWQAEISLVSLMICASLAASPRTWMHALHALQAVHANRPSIVGMGKM